MRDLRQPDLSSPVTFPNDFTDHLVQFKEASGMSWRALAKALGVKPYRIREWRRGVTPNTLHLIQLLGLAERLGLGEVLTTGSWVSDTTQGRETATQRPLVGFKR